MNRDPRRALTDDMRLNTYDGPNATANTKEGRNVLHIATVQFALIDPDRPGRELPCCSVLALSGDKIISEQAYLNIAEWPGARPDAA
ncbi:MAG: hypothetical protein K0Q76_2679 [Panacagrimonas sp.]|jgi:hypothetical protein|nr:hypothetical protein [Panacagrimonas sp.]MCC2657571.1 hypothetical protein [Panacagrimonas sp.]